MNAYLGSGCVFFRATNWTSERYIAQTENFDVAPSQETADRLDTNGGALFIADRETVRTQTAITFGSVDVDLQNLQLLFGTIDTPGNILADASPFVSTGSEADGYHQFTGEPMAATVSSVVYANEGAPVEGTHYELDLTTGRIKTLQDGLGVVTVTFSVAASVQGFRTTVIEPVRGELRLIGGNVAGGDAWNVHIADCVLAPSGTLSLKGVGDFTRIVWSVEVLNNSLVISGPAV